MPYLAPAVYELMSASVEESASSSLKCTLATSVDLAHDTSTPYCLLDDVRRLAIGLCGRIKAAVSSKLFVFPVRAVSLQKKSSDACSGTSLQEIPSRR